MQPVDVTDPMTNVARASVHILNLFSTSTNFLTLMILISRANGLSFVPTAYHEELIQLFLEQCTIHHKMQR